MSRCLSRGWCGEMRLLFLVLLFPLLVPAQPAPKEFVEVCYSNPGWEIWKMAKREFLSPGGPAYLQQILKANFPTMKGEVVSVSGSDVLVKIHGAETPEALLRVSGRLPDKLSKPGARINFSGSVTAFHKEPFQLTFSVDADKITKWD
jgi:hypothetical protein